MRAADLLVAGSPCTDFSPSGKRMRLKGPTLKPTLSWFRLARRSKVFVHENVRQFPAAVHRAMLKRNVKKVKKCMKKGLLRTHRMFKFKVATNDTGYGKLNQRDRVYRIGIRHDVEMVGASCLCSL